jgi:hypothetical protein
MPLGVRVSHKFWSFRSKKVVSGYSQGEEGVKKN